MKKVILYTLLWLPVLSACGQTNPVTEGYTDIHTETAAVIEHQTDGISDWESIADSICGIQECNLNIEESAWEKYKEYTVVFDLDDFAPQEIICENVFSSYRNGRENPEIQALYDAAGEQWEYLWYVEYDYDDDGEQDYLVLHDWPDKEGGAGIGGGDVWLAKDFRNRIKLPRTTYLTGGTWEAPQLNMMLLAYVYEYWNGIPSIAVYRDYGESEMVLYGWNGDYRRIRGVTVTEDVSGVKVVQTGLSLAYWEIEFVRLQLIREDGGQHFTQTILISSVRRPLKTGMSNCTAWDGNDDGYEDILYYAGYDGGSGGTWDFNYLLCWSKEEQQYICMELPRCCTIDFERHKLYSWGQNGVSNPWYEIYGLWDGEYQQEKELDFRFDGWMENGRDTVTYYEHGEAVEELDITDLEVWQEINAFLIEKYPDFFWIEEVKG